jgi:hypothetical protein
MAEIWRIDQEMGGGWDLDAHGGKGKKFKSKCAKIEQ